ncbi:unnamed protein product [Brassicogethes aeneus]|uniref:Sex-determining region Y protein n=1 Tax=Brassicogethes aeneus TaxID=1431903 RepID=A0A9P0B950_BRAAE|nr:unnamed protein product [Brassicogethes aeneus]
MDSSIEYQPPTPNMFCKLEENLKKQNDLTTKSLGRRGNIKRPMNAFMIWSKMYRKKLLNKFPKKHVQEVSKMLSAKWKSLPPSEKKIYIDEAERLKQLHMETYPDYKFCPKRKNKVSNPTLLKEGSAEKIKEDHQNKLPIHPGYVQPHIQNMETNVPYPNGNTLLVLEEQSATKIKMDHQNKLPIHPGYVQPHIQNMETNVPYPNGNTLLVLEEQSATKIKMDHQNKLPVYPGYVQPHNMETNPSYLNGNVHNQAYYSSLSWVFSCYQTLQAKFPTCPSAMVWNMALSMSQGHLP